MKYALISLHSQASETLPFILVQMEAVEKVLPPGIKTQRILLGVCEDSFIRALPEHFDKVFLFGLGKLTQKESAEIKKKIDFLEKKIHLIAVDCPEGGSFTELECELIRKSAAGGAQITTVNETATAAVLKVEPTASVQTLGYLESLLEVTPLVSKNPLVVNCCSDLHRSQIPVPSLTVYLSDSASQEKEIGFLSLHTAAFPGLGLKAISTANCIVTSDETLARISLCLKKTVLLIKKEINDSALRLLATDLSCLRTENEFCIQVREKQTLIQSNSIPSLIEGHRKKWKKYFSADELVNSSLGLFSESRELNVAVVCDSKYLAYLSAFCQNLVEVHPGKIQIVVLWLGNPSEFTLMKDFPEITFYPVQKKDVWDEDQLERIGQWPVAEQAYAAKPAVLFKALELLRAPVLLSDLDVWYFRSPAHLLKSVNNKKLLLFLQWSDRFEWLRKHGFVNSGMVVAYPGAEKLLRFWSVACAQSSAINSGEGLFGDQGYLDYAALLYEDCVIYRGFDENVAPWNRQSLNLALPEIGKVGFEVMNGIKVGSFHAAGPDTLGAFELKFLWDQLCSVFNFKVPDLMDMPLWKNLLEQQRLHSDRLDQVLRIKERWQHRVPSLRSYSASSITQGLTGVWAQVIGFINKLTCLVDRLRSYRMIKPDNFDLQWRDVQKQAISDRMTTSSV